jgi:hypothetical protein
LPKNLTKIFSFLPKLLLVFTKKLACNWFVEKMPFFSQKIAENWQKSQKIAENWQKSQKIAENWQKSQKIVSITTARNDYFSHGQ